MPTRYLKPGIRDSEKIEALSDGAEVLFYRLLVTVDDYGRFDARPTMIKAACFPIRLSVTPEHCAAMLAELMAADLIDVYTVDGKPYAQIKKWDNVPRAQVSKFPPPPDGAHPRELLEIVSEEDLETMICDSVVKSREFAGMHVISHARQVRVDQSYLDIVLTTDGGQVGLELKRNRISKASVDQVVKYKNMTSMPFVLIGSGIGGGVDLSECAKNDIAVAVYDENFCAKVVIKSSVISRDFTLRHVHSKTGTGTGTGTDNRKPEPTTGNRKPKTETVVRATPAGKRVTASDSPTAKTWEAYSDSYRQRYGVDPVRNASVNGQLSQFVSRIGADESPHVAAYYLTHNNAFYVRAGHSVGPMLKDAEKLRTEWATHRQITATGAQQADRTQTNFDAFAPLLAEARAKAQVHHDD